MPESRNLPASPAQDGDATPFKRYLFRKITGMLVGGIVGGVAGTVLGNATAWLRPVEVLGLAVPYEGAIGAVVGIVIGGTLTGGRIGHQMLFFGTIAGMFFSLSCPSKGGPFCHVQRIVAGMLIGFSVGTLLEIKRHRTSSSK